MNAMDKKKLSDEKRLKAVRQWKMQGHHISNIKNTCIKFGLPDKKLQADENKLNLFEESAEECSDNENAFKVRSQFEGENGQKLLMMSSHFSNRFKLDERFADNEDCTVENGKNDEKTKNIKILESVLGYEVSEKYPKRKSTSIKTKFDRFDPEDESSCKFIKIQESGETNQRKIKTKKEITEIHDEVPISNERYIEVSSNLKEILSSSTTPFSFSQTFESEENHIEAHPSSLTTQVNFMEKKTSDSNKEEMSSSVTKTRNTMDKTILKNNYFFFIKENNSVLKEGVKFFQRKKSLDDIHEDWLSKKDNVLELFKLKRKLCLRKFVSKPRASERNKFKAKK